MNRITSLFGIQYPIIQGGMVWCSGWRLASAVSNAGGLGLLGAGSMHPETLREHIRKCRAATDRPFGVNIPLMYPQIEEYWLGLGEGDTKLLLKKLAPTRLVRNNFRDAVERAEDGGASAEELRTLLGRGRAKKGIFEGDLEEGELEIGQVSAIVSRQQSVAEVMNELVEAMQRAAEKKYW